MVRVPKQRAKQGPPDWIPPRDLSAEGKTFRAHHPALLLHLWCNFSGVHVLAHVDWLDEKDRLVRKEIARATWQPPEVSERLVVEWAERALRAWLERPENLNQPPS